MKPAPQFIGQDSRFWAYVRLISERVGYSKSGSTIEYRYKDVVNCLRRLKLSTEGFGSKVGPTAFGEMILDYLNFRSNLLELEARPNLMDGEEALNLYKEVSRGEQYVCPLPMNKQKGKMKHLNYLTCLVNIITEQELHGYFFDGDPRNLTVILDDGKPVAVLSRRVDGVYPSVIGAKAIWEIKEYYDNKSFGSRIADGVYETLLDGYELEKLRDEHGIEVKHYLIIDSYSTWWEKGLSYLCRLVDGLHMGLVDEVIVGKQVVSRWPEIVHSWRD